MSERGGDDQAVVELVMSGRRREARRVGEMEEERRRWKECGGEGTRKKEEGGWRKRKKEGR
jgi:hypothetical protein